MTELNEKALDRLLKMACKEIAKENAKQLSEVDVSNVKFDTRYYKRKQQILDSLKKKPDLNMPNS